MNVDKLTRWTAIVAVLAVAAVAGWVSYWHCTGLVTAHGEPGTTGHLYAATIDGLIIAASMVLLDAARHGDEIAPRLAWWMLGTGIGGTLAVNVLAGLASGWLGAVIAGWPAAAFVAGYELLMLLVRASARRDVVGQGDTDETTSAAGDNGPETAPDAASSLVAPEVPPTVHEAAKAAYVASIRGANPISERGLADRFGLPRSQVKKLRAEVAAASNGGSGN